MIPWVAKCRGSAIAELLSLSSLGAGIYARLLDPDVRGTFEREQLRGVAAKSNEVLVQLQSDIQWVESYMAENKTSCIYLAKDEAIIRKNAEISGCPATKITEVKRMIDPTTDA